MKLIRIEESGGNNEHEYARTCGIKFQELLGTHGTGQLGIYRKLLVNQKLFFRFSRYFDIIIHVIK